MKEFLKEAEAMRNQRKQASSSTENFENQSQETTSQIKEISTNPFIFVKTSGLNLYCGFFAIANRIKFCNYQNRRSGYHRIGLNADVLKQLFLSVIYDSPKIEFDNFFGEKKPESNIEIYQSILGVKDFLTNSEFRKSLYSLYAVDYRLMRIVSQMIYQDKFNETTFQLGLADSKLDNSSRKKYLDQCLIKLEIVICDHKFSKDQAFDLPAIITKYQSDQNFRAKLNSEFIDDNFFRYTGLAYDFAEFGDILRDLRSSSSTDIYQLDKPSLFDIFDQSQYSLIDFVVDIPKLKLSEKKAKLLIPNYYQKMLGFYLQEQYLKKWRKEFEKIFWEQFGFNQKILLEDGYLDDHTIPYQTQHLILQKFDPNFLSMSFKEINYQLHTDLDFQNALSQDQRAMQYAIINPSNDHYTTLLTFEQYLDYCKSSSIEISLTREKISEQQKAQRIEEFAKKFSLSSAKSTESCYLRDISASEFQESLDLTDQQKLRTLLKILITKASKDHEIIKAISNPQIALKEFVSLELRVGDKNLTLEYGRTRNGVESFVFNLHQFKPSKYQEDDIYQICFDQDTISILKREQIYGGSGLEFSYQEISNHLQKTDLITDCLDYLEQHNLKIAKPKLEQQVLNLARFLTLKQSDELIHSIATRCQFTFGFSSRNFYLFAMDNEEKIEITMDNLQEGNSSEILFVNQSPNSKEIWQEKIDQFNQLIKINQDFVSMSDRSSPKGSSPKGSSPKGSSPIESSISGLSLKCTEKSISK